MRNPIKPSLWRSVRGSESCKLKPPHACFWNCECLFLLHPRNTQLHSTFFDQGEQSKWEDLGSEHAWMHNLPLCLLLSPVAVEELSKSLSSIASCFSKSQTDFISLIEFIPVKWGKTGRYIERNHRRNDVGFTCQGHGVSSTMVPMFSSFQNGSVSPRNLERRQILFLNLAKDLSGTDRLKNA